MNVFKIIILVSIFDTTSIIILVVFKIAVYSFYKILKNKF